MSASTRHEARSLPAGRTPSDATLLLLELGRAARAREFLPEGDPSREAIVERSWRIWQGELARHGPLELELREGTFWLAGTEIPVGRGRLEALARTLEGLRVQALSFGPDLAEATFGALIDGIRSEGGGWSRLELEGVRLGRAAPDGGGSGEASASQEEQEEAARLPPPAASRVPPVEAEQSLGVETGGTRGEGSGGRSGVDEPAGEEGAAFGSAAVGLEPASVAPSQAEPPPPPPAEASELGLCLQELEEAGEELDSYRALCERAAALAEPLVESGSEDVARGFELLLRHAGDDAKRTEAQRGEAARTLRLLFRGALRTHWMARAASPRPQEHLTASLLLLHLGADGAAALFDGIAGEADPVRRQRLTGAFVSMGDAVLPVLGHAADAGDPERSQLALRLAGETQHPQLLGLLRRKALEGDPDTRREALRALVRLGSEPAVRALGELAQSPDLSLGLGAAASLGGTGSPHAVVPLVACMERALARGERTVSLEAVRALGALGCPEALPALEALFERRPLRHRKAWRELKLAAVAALTRMPGAAAEAALERGAKSRDARLRRAARLAMAARSANA